MYVALLFVSCVVRCSHPSSLLHLAGQRGWRHDESRAVCFPACKLESLA